MIRGWPRVRNSHGSSPTGTPAGPGVFQETVHSHFSPPAAYNFTSHPNSPTRLFLPALDPLASIHISSPPVQNSLPRDLQEGLAGEPKSRFPLSRHKWRVGAREAELMQEWLGFSKKKKNTEQTTGPWGIKPSPLPLTPLHQHHHPALPTHLFEFRDQDTTTYQQHKSEESLITAELSHSIWKKIIIKITVLFHKLFWG